MGKSFRLVRLGGIVALAAFLVLAWAQQDTPPAQAAFTDSDGDGALDIAEEIAGSDPDDPDSHPESTGAVFLSGLPLCSDDVDNDLDGLTDGDDPGCVDSDGDIVSDPGETFLGSDPTDGASFPEDSRLDALLDFNGLPVVFCADGVDNDGDGLTDEDDPGCTPIRNDGDGFDDATEKRFGSDPADPNSVPEHETPNPGSCSDGVDNDLDGLTDGGDPACGVPTNDNRADAAVITALPFTDGPLVMKNAGTEPDEPAPGCADFRGVDSTVWYTFTPTEDALLIADTAGSDFDTILAVWIEGASGLTEVACNTNFPFAQEARIIFQATADQAYFFQVGGSPVDDPFPSLTFNLDVGTPPANDDFAAATDITTLPFTDSVDTSAATTEFGEPASSCAFGEVDSTVWYTLTPTEDTLLVADTTGSDFDTVLAVWTESAFGLAEVACNNNIGETIQSRLAFQPTAGQTYFFQVSRFPFFLDPTAFSLTFNLDAGTAPANDDFDDATAITTLPYTDSVDTLPATTEPGEPTPSCLFDGIASTVWYSFTPDADSFLAADTVGSDFFETAIGVYQGTSLPALSEVACGTPSFSREGPRTRVAFAASAGQTYIFQVGGLSSEGVILGNDSFQEDGRRSDSDYFQKGGRPVTSGLATTSAGNLVFNLDIGTPLANDAFADATTITSLPFTDGPLSTVNATTEPGEPSPCVGIAATVWYDFTPTEDTVLVADTFGSDFDTALAVYTGDTLTELAGIDCNDDSAGVQSQVQFSAAAGIIYHFQAGGFFGGSGDLVFHLASLGPPPACPPEGNDGFEAGLVDTNAIPCWTVVDQSGASGSWCIQAGTVPPEGTCSGSSEPVAAPPEGSQAAMANQSGPGSHVLYRCFQLPPALSSASVSFELYMNNQAGEFFSPPSLDFAGPPNQQFRADLLTAAAIDADPFTVAPEDVLLSIYQTQPGDPPVSGYTTVTADIGAFAGQEVCLRFAEVDNQLNFQVGVDAVQVATLGDADCDGSLDSIDAALVLQLDSGLIDSLPCAGAADVNRDGAIDDIDAALILQLDAGLIDSPPPPPPLPTPGPISPPNGLGPAGT